MVVRQGEQVTLITAEPTIQAFCEGLAEYGCVTSACEAAGVSKVTAYRWKKKWPGFAQRWEQALDASNAALRREIHYRAMSRNRPAAASDAMLRWWTRSRMPEEFVDKNLTQSDIRIVIEHKAMGPGDVVDGEARLLGEDEATYAIEAPAEDVAEARQDASEGIPE